MKTNVRFLAVMMACLVAGVLAWTLVVHPQGQAPAPGTLPRGARGQAPVPGGAPVGPPQAGPGADSGGGSTENGLALFQTRCFTCHGNPAVEKATSPSAIREMTPERIYESLTTGSMKMQGEAFTEPQKRQIAEFMASRPLNSSKLGNAKDMPNKCASNPALTNPTAGVTWTGWGNDLANTRFQPAARAGLTAAQVPQLKLKWAFGYPTGASSNGQPTIVSGRVFVGSDNGFVYSLDAKTGCVYWSFENGAMVRGAPAVGPITGQGASRYAVYFGDAKANVFAVDAQDGRLLWKTKADPHWVARITASSALYNGKLFVPMSSSEEFRSGDSYYPCCTSRGSLVALDANTGKEVWKAWVVPEEPKPYAKNPNGIVLYKPAGGSVWSAPTVDPVRSAVYFSTGDATTAPSPKTTDGVMAVDINTGKLLWSYQADENDVFMGGCPRGDTSASLQCPNPNGPDLDIGNSPILKALPGGKRVLIAGTKRGHVFALDPDSNGTLVYRVSAATGAPVAAAAAPAGAGRGGAGGSIVWGGAADDQFVYYGAGGAGLTALRLATGERAWAFTSPQGGGALGAAPTVIPGVVFEGSGGGRLYAVSSADGKLLWEFNTAQPFDTVNKVAGAHGGAISVSGAVVVNGMLYIGSGYGISSAAPTTVGNVLLAFGID